MSEKLSIAVLCTPGLEFVTCNELGALGLKVDRRPGKSFVAPGIIECKATRYQLYNLNLHLRTAARVLVRLETYFAASFSELSAKAEKLPWGQCIAPGQPISVRVATVKSKLYHKRGIAERIASAISKALGVETPLANVEKEGAEHAFVQQVVVRIVKDQCMIGIDSSGENLHRRGYRLQTAKAPIRENLAAAMVLISGWKKDRALIDPFCGSGTIPIEAAMLAAGIPPGINRAFAFQQWPEFDANQWKEIVSKANNERVEKVPLIIGSDRDAGAIEASRANAERAGIGGMIEWKCQSISDFSAPENAGWIVTNPPYGQRIQGGPDLRDLYARMGSIWLELLPVWHIYMLISSPRWAGQLGLAVQECASFENGGVPVKLLKAGLLEQNHE